MTCQNTASVHNAHVRHATDGCRHGVDHSYQDSERDRHREAMASLHGRARFAYLVQALQEADNSPSPRAHQARVQELVDAAQALLPPP